MNRKEAAECGMKTYETGVPCKHGHIAPRYTSTGGCIKCLNAPAQRVREVLAMQANERRFSAPLNTFAPMNRHKLVGRFAALLRNRDSEAGDILDLFIHRLEDSNNEQLALMERLAMGVMIGHGPVLKDMINLLVPEDLGRVPK